VTSSPRPSPRSRRHVVDARRGNQAGGSMASAPRSVKADSAGRESSRRSTNNGIGSARRRSRPTSRTTPCASWGASAVTWRTIGRGWTIRGSAARAYRSPAVRWSRGSSSSTGGSRGARSSGTTTAMPKRCWSCAPDGSMTRRRSWSVSETSRLHADPDADRLMAKGVSPYGDGKASARIALAVGRFLSVEPLKAAG
jgi:hypothetical protein